MFKKKELLDSSKHQDLRLAKNFDFTFAKNISSAVLSISEITMASLHYPIVFPVTGDCLPLALFSLETDKNLFVDGEGAWKASYIPAQVRHYPFGMVTVAKNQEDFQKKAFAVCVDGEAPHFEAGQGEPLFMADGKPVELILTLMKVLEGHQKELEVAKHIFKQVEDQGLLVEKQLNFEKNGQKAVFKGLRVVDMEKLKSLGDEILAGWVKNGTIAFIYDHVRSLGNFKRLAGSRISLT